MFIRRETTAMSQPVTHFGIIALTLLSVVSSAAADDEPLTTESPDQRELTADASVRYALETKPGDFVLGYVDQISVDVVVHLVKPDGSTLRRINVSKRGREWFQFETEDEGNYVVEIQPSKSAEGEFKISLERLEPVAKDPKKLADQLLAAYAGEDSPGVVVNVFKDGEVLFSKAYGMANLTHGVPYALDTPTNIGSTSKQFTAFAILLLCEEGKVSLDDDVRKHIPELPDFGEVVTVRHLLSHTTGYREFLNLIAITGRRLDRGDSIDRKEVIAIVQRQPTLQNSPGDEFNYNNTAFALAAEIVARVSEMSFPEFMKTRVFDPLGMHNTQVRPSPAHIIPGRSEGYTPSEDGTFIVARDLGAAMGAGGIYSTVGDLQNWIENYDDPQVGTADMIETMMTETKLNNGEGTGYGLGLFLAEHRGLRWVHHGGADSAHRSHLSYYPTINAGITTQSNHASFDGSIAGRLAEAFFAEHMEPESESEDDDSSFDADTYEPKSFDRNTGRFALDNNRNFVLQITRQKEKFFVQATSQPRLEIEPLSETRFKVVDVEAELEFHADDKEDVDAVTLHQNGAAQRASRVKDDTWKPSAKELEAYVGRYYSEEIETFYEFSINKDDKLQAEHRRRDPLVMDPSTEDTFSAGALSVEFEHDRNGRVIGFYISNGRTRDVRFQRVP